MNYTSLKTVWWLLWRDIRVIRKDLFNHILDTLLLPLSFILINGYVMPVINVPQWYGTFMVAGWLVTMCMNTPATDTWSLAMDLEGEKRISYELTLPLPYWLVYVKYALVYAIKSIIINFLILPVSMILLWGQFNLLEISYIKTFICYITINIFFSFFCSYTSVALMSVEHFGRFWQRWGWQLLSIGGMTTSWLMMYEASHIAAYLNLLNPCVYAFESMRSALFGPTNYLNFWACIAILWCATFFFALRGIIIFKKRLDCL